MTATDREEEGDVVSLRAFAARVPMKESTARDWEKAGLIKAHRTPRRRLMVSLDQLPTIRAALGISDDGGE